MAWWKSQTFAERLAVVEAKISKLESEHRSLMIEWENTYDKMRAVLMKVSRRAEALHTEAEERGDLFPGRETLSESEQAILSHLPPAQRGIQLDILRRRKQVARNGG